MRQVRVEAGEQAAGLGRVELELIHTQAALLISHAQIERQKLSMQFAPRLGVVP